jgi:hypothetical protein
MILNNPNLYWLSVLDHYETHALLRENHLIASSGSIRTEFGAPAPPLRSTQKAL